VTIVASVIVFFLLASVALLVPLIRKPRAGRQAKGRSQGPASARPSGAPAGRVLARPAVRPTLAPTAGGPRPAAPAAATAVASSGVTILPPPELADFELLRHDEMPPERLAALVADLRSIPRPPVSLHKLVSPSFLENAGSVELSELIMGEALIAAKVLATVNSPMFGLREPVLSIGQGIVFLGLNSVRSICLRYLLDKSFKAVSPALRRRYDLILKASAIASELATRLSVKLELPQPGALVTQVVLAYLGQLATVSLLHQQGNDSLPPAGLQDRARDEQHQLGLAAAEIGGLLMEIWGLPSGIVDDVRDIDRLLVAPINGRDLERRLRQALCYLCARLGDRLASGELADLADFDLAGDAGSELFYLHASLTAPQETQLADALRSHDVLHAVRQLTFAVR
jgi:HD-like signal output (HDOD) protein